MIIRCDGETISKEKTYSGKRVLELLNASYQHGYRRGLKEAQEKSTHAETTAFCKGYKDGYDTGIEEVKQLKNALSNILGIKQCTSVE